MLVSAAIQQVRDDLLETSSAGPFTDSVIVNALTEGYRHLNNKISQVDTDGQWVGVEVDYTYTGGTRWVSLATWTGGTYPPNRVITLLDLSGGTKQIPTPISFISPQALYNREFASGGRSTYQAVLKGNELGLRQVGTDTPPTGDVATRMLYVPTVTPITTSDTAKTIGVDFPFPADYTEAIIAYAVVRLQMSEETPSGQFESRYAQLERSLLEMIRERRRQTATPPEVRLSNPALYY